MYNVFQKDGFDYFTDMMPALHNYVTVDTKVKSDFWKTCVSDPDLKLFTCPDPGSRCPEKSDSDPKLLSREKM